MIRELNGILAGGETEAEKCLRATERTWKTDGSEYGSSTETMQTGSFLVVSEKIYGKIRKPGGAKSSEFSHGRRHHQWD